MTASDCGIEGMAPGALVGSLLALTFATGLVDAVSFLALGQVFTANMTGNVVLLGFAGFSSGLSVPRSLTALALFLVGAGVGGLLAARMQRVPRRRWVATAFACEAVLVLAAAAIAWNESALIAEERRVYLMIVLLALAMGLRNATVRRLGVRDLVTTVLTSSITDLGMALALPERRAAWKRAVASTLLMLLGALAGAFLLRQAVALPLAASGVCAALCAMAVARERTPGVPAPQKGI